MRTKSFLTITALTLMFYALIRYFGWVYFNQTITWQNLNHDYWHHWQLGILLLFIAFVFLKNRPMLKDALFAIGSGQIIDELTYAIFPQENIFQFSMMLKQWYKPLGFEILLFAIFSLLIYKIKSSDRKASKYSRYLLT